MGQVDGNSTLGFTFDDLKAKLPSQDTSLSVVRNARLVTLDVAQGNPLGLDLGEEGGVMRVTGFKPHSPCPGAGLTVGDFVLTVSSSSS